MPDNSDILDLVESVSAVTFFYWFSFMLPCFLVYVCLLIITFKNNLVGSLVSRLNEPYLIEVFCQVHRHPRHGPSHLEILWFTQAMLMQDTNTFKDQSMTITIKKKKFLFIYLFLAALGFRCCERAFL